MITIANLSYQYPSSNNHPITALDDISLSIREGEYVAVMGSNGSGKTTLARCLNGLLQPAPGHISVNGLDPADPSMLWEIRRCVGMVFQNPDNQIISTTVEQEIAFGLENLGIPGPAIREKIEETLRAFDLDQYRHFPPHWLSGGEKQRLVAASVMAMEPTYLILDEPTSLLDPSGQTHFKDLLEKIHSGQKTTIVLITQFPEEALRADRLVIMARGRIVADGHPRAVFSREEELGQWNLAAPAAFQLDSMLRRAGWSLPPQILTGSMKYPLRDAVPDGQLAAHSGQHAGDRDVIMVEHLSHVFDDGLPAEQAALTDVCLSIQAGECLAVIGPTGSGKTTLAEHMTGLLRPMSGTIRVFGGELWKGRRRPHIDGHRTGFVFQFPELQFFEETVLDEIAFAPRNLGCDPVEIAHRVGKAMEQVGLDATFGARSPLSLSAGEQRLVAVASILSMKPEILILDEPTAGLDPGAVAGIAELIRTLHEQGITIVLISHHLDLVAQVAGRIVVINHGRIILDGPPRFVWQHENLLASIGLDIPEPARIVRTLRAMGWDIETDALTLEEARDAILAYQIHKAHPKSQPPNPKQIPRTKP